MQPVHEEIRRRHQDGWSQRRIAQELGVSRHQVRKAIDTGGTTMAPAVMKRAPVAGVKVTGLAGRASQDKSGTLGLLANMASRGMDAETTRALGVDGRLLNPDSMKKMRVDELVEAAAKVSPEMSRALWDYLRMAVNGYEIEVFEPGTETPHDTGQAIIDQFRARLAWRHGDESVIYRRLFISAWMRGMMVLELEMDDRGSEPFDIVTPDPAQFSFKLIDGRWQIGQWQKNEWVPMDRPTFRYVALDPFPGRPEGTAPVGSALFPCLFLLGLFQDMRRVIANQGYPRLDISINTEMLAEILDNDGTMTAEEFDQQSAKLIDLVIAAVNNVGPGDAYVHADLVTMNQPIGAITSDLASVDSIIQGLERMATRALKANPLTMGLTDVGSEANANRLWEAWVASIDSVQKPGENLLQSIYELVLQAYGVIADVRVRFAQIRASEAFRDAQTKRVELTNIGYMQDRGYLTPKQAAEMAAGFVSDSVDAAYGEDANGYAPAPSQGSGDSEAESDVPEPGEPGDGADRHVVQLAKAGEVDDDGNMFSRKVLEKIAEQIGGVVDDAGILWATSDHVGQRIGELVPPVPTTVSVAEGDLRTTSQAFDELEPDHAGLLDAEVTT